MKHTTVRPKHCSEEGWTALLTLLYTCKRVLTRGFMHCTAASLPRSISSNKCPICGSKNTIADTLSCVTNSRPAAVCWFQWLASWLIQWSVSVPSSRPLPITLFSAQHYFPLCKLWLKLIQYNCRTVESAVVFSSKLHITIPAVIFHPEVSEIIFVDHPVQLRFEQHSRMIINYIPCRVSKCHSSCMQCCVAAEW